jgi:2,3-bisphosphoglycerate-dependent phosphoglycerate mutase
VFTGWVDVPLSKDGINEALRAGEKIADIEFDLIYTSMQVRALETALIAMSVNKSDKTPTVIHETGKMGKWTAIYDDSTRKNIIPVYRDWHLNERYYGELQGKDKAGVEEKFGKEKTLLWRRSYDVPPPGGESLKDTAGRTIPFFKKFILENLKKGRNILISAHGNSLRSIVMFIDHLTREQVLRLEIPTGKPLFYEYRNQRLEKIPDIL